MPVRTVPLDRSAIVIGRDPSCDVAIPEDAGLSRQHCRIERLDDDWSVRDLSSRNGTFINGEKLDGARNLRPGDTVKVSRTHLRIGGAPIDAGAVVFDRDTPQKLATQNTVVVQLKDLLAVQAKLSRASDPGPPSVGSWSQAAHALLRAGRELVAGRPLSELFRVILDLSIEAVAAERGVLLTLENGVLAEQASTEGQFRISSVVRDKVLNERASMLVHDVMGNAALQDRQSILLENVLSLMAVPLQTEDRVIGLLYVDTRSMQRPFLPDDLNLLTVMANIAAIRIERARLALVEHAQQAHRMELEQAASIQRLALPSRPPDVPGFRIDGKSVPCLTVGGDYFDYLRLASGRTICIVADVAGKGMPAALLVMSLQAHASALAGTCNDLLSFVTRLNESVAPRCPQDRFITMFVCAMEHATGRLEYCNAGHNPPLLLRRSGATELLQTGGPPLCILPRFLYSTGNVLLEEGDRLFLYTDGISEAENASEEGFEVERLEQVIRRHPDAAPASLIEAVLQSVDEWTSGVTASDDRTAVALELRTA